jgi:hypothetical protein
VVRFDDIDFGQDGWGAKAPFTSSKVSRISFGHAVSGPLDFWIDDVVLLKAD